MDGGLLNLHTECIVDIGKKVSRHHILGFLCLVGFLLFHKFYSLHLNLKA
jgi:hypothetical protein